MMTWDRPFSIAMLALGGQGGGVLTRWLVDIAEHNGYFAQSTFVAGVAQRTGATVYCVEMFPASAARDGREPVFTTYPIPGDVDVVVAGELGEAGRAILKGFVTPNITTLIASTHRVYSINEKVALGDGIMDLSPVLKTAGQVSRELIAFDMDAAANECGCPISAVMLGAIAASGIAGFDKDDFEAAIRRDGRAVDSNLRGFRRGFEAALEGVAEIDEPAEIGMPEPKGANGVALLQRAAQLPDGVAPLAAHGALRALEYQDRAYAEAYLTRVESLVELDDSEHLNAVSSAYARNLALQMCYEDTLRIAQLKTSGERFDRVRNHLGVSADQVAYFQEYFHPRFEEVCDTLPARLGAILSGSSRARRWLALFFSKGRNVSTNKLGGYLMLSTLARFRRWRRHTYRFANQEAMLEDWRSRISDALASDYQYALALAEGIEIVRGYGETWERGLERFNKSVMVSAATESSGRGKVMRRLHKAALADEDGNLFFELLSEYETA